jgi:hypothetical protein
MSDNRISKYKLPSVQNFPTNFENRSVSIDTGKSPIDTMHSTHNSPSHKWSGPFRPLAKGHFGESF